MKFLDAVMASKGASTDKSDWHNQPFCYKDHENGVRGNRLESHRLPYLQFNPFVEELIIAYASKSNRLLFTEWLDILNCLHRDAEFDQKVNFAFKIFSQINIEARDTLATTNTVIFSHDNTITIPRLIATVNKIISKPLSNAQISELTKYCYEGETIIPPSGMTEQIFKNLMIINKNDFMSSFTLNIYAS